MYKTGPITRQSETSFEFNEHYCFFHIFGSEISLIIYNKFVIFYLSIESKKY